MPVRDREAPGSNPGAPDQICIQIEVFALLRLTCGVTGRSQIFLEPGGGAPSKWISSRQLKSLTAINGRTYYFCIAGCKARFDKNPENFIRAAEKSVMSEDH